HSLQILGSGRLIPQKVTQFVMHNGS
ncbi:hypothetical protein A2U01_0081025, partial [Trifolium medium]|nr:hypothetical protein [Trifolium medium]